MTKTLAHRYKTHNTPAALGKLTDLQLKALGVESEKDRKLVLAAFRKAGYKTAGGAAAETAAGGGIATSSSGAGAVTGKGLAKGKVSCPGHDFDVPAALFPFALAWTANADERFCTVSLGM